MAVPTRFPCCLGCTVPVWGVNWGGMRRCDLALAAVTVTQHSTVSILVPEKATKWLTERCSVQRGPHGDGTLQSRAWTKGAAGDFKRRATYVWISPRKFLDQRWPQVTEIMENKAARKGTLMYLAFPLSPRQFLGEGFTISFVPSAYWYFISFKRLKYISGSLIQGNSTIQQVCCPKKFPVLFVFNIGMFILNKGWEKYLSR